MQGRRANRRRYISGTEFEQRIQLADDVIATLALLIEEDEQGQLEADAHFAAVLARHAGLDQLEGAPAFSMSVLNDKQLCADMRTYELPDLEYDAVLATEAIVNTARELAERDAVSSDAADEDIVTAARHLVMERHRIAPRNVGSSLDDWAKELDDEAEDAQDEPYVAPACPEEWDLRYRLAQQLSHLPVVHSVSWQFDCSSSRRVACIDFVVPSSAMLAFIAQDVNDEIELNRLVKELSIRYAMMIARHAFFASSAIDRVIVIGHGRMMRDRFVSYELSRETFHSFYAELKSCNSEVALPPGIAIDLDSDGKMKPLSSETLLDSGSMPLSSSAEKRMIEFDGRGCSTALHLAMGARYRRDLGVHENAERIDIADALDAFADASTSDVVGYLLKRRDESEDDLTVEACNRLMTKLVEGELEISDEDEVRKVLLKSSKLDYCIERSLLAMNEAEEQFDIRTNHALEILEDVLAPLDKSGIYQDDDDVVYRCFDSVFERVRYNLDSADEERRLELVPSSYFDAHFLAAQHCLALGNLGKTQAHVDILLRIAPYSESANLLQTLIYEKRGCYQDAIDFASKAIESALHLDEAVGYLCRIATCAEKLGRFDLALLCYMRGRRWNTKFQDYIHEALSRLYHSRNDLEPVEGPDVPRLLKENNISIGMDADVLKVLFRVARACCNEGMFYFSSVFANEYSRATFDSDVLRVSHSLANSR